jgi:hypothetical protein
MTPTMAKEVPGIHDPEPLQRTLDELLLEESRENPCVKAATYTEVSQWFQRNRPAHLVNLAAQRSPAAPGQEQSQVFVGQLPGFATDDLLTMCLEFVLGVPGAVLYSLVRREPGTANHAGYALATVAGPDYVPRFIALNRHIFLGRTNLFYAPTHAAETFQRTVARYLSFEVASPTPVNRAAANTSRACLVIAPANPPTRRQRATPNAAQPMSSVPMGAMPHASATSPGSAVLYATLPPTGMPAPAPPMTWMLAPPQQQRQQQQPPPHQPHGGGFYAVDHQGYLVQVPPMHHSHTPASYSTMAPHHSAFIAPQFATVYQHSTSPPPVWGGNPVFQPAPIPPMPAQHYPPGAAQPPLPPAFAQNAVYYVGPPTSEPGPPPSGQRF